jgi:hypothetical protein
MKKLLSTFLLLTVLLAACAPATPLPGPTETPTSNNTSTPDNSATPTLEPSPTYPPEGYGPSNFPGDVNPLTGLKVADPALLDRRPIMVKVSNLPRSVRPQWGLSLADIVFEYYTEEGTTRFAAIYYGNDASMVGPIRSGRFFDANIVRGYKALFVFAGAYVVEMNRFLNSDYANRIVIAGSSSPLFWYDPTGFNYLMVNTADLSAYLTARGVANGRQNLDNMSFILQAPSEGLPGNQAIIRHSASIYNRWDYDPSTGKYVRYSDTVDDFDVQNEAYAQLTDRLTNQPITADNVVVVFANHNVYYTDSNGNNIYDITFNSTGKAVLFRDGHAYRVRWHRNEMDVVSLTDSVGNPFAFKPGSTWFEVVGANSTDQQTDQTWRFTHIMP